MGRSALIAALVVVALVLWMASGQMGSDQKNASQNRSESVGTTSTTEEKPVVKMKVQTRVQSAESITREVVVQGQLEPLQVLTLRAETAGNIEALPGRKGQRIGRGEMLARLSIDNRSADLAVAQANLAQANNEYQAARKLQRQGLQSTLSLEATSAKREAAKAHVQAAELEFANTSIAAPIDALIEDIMVKEGDFIQRGDALATLVDNSQLLVTGSVPQQLIGDVEQGQKASAKLVTGETLEGRVTYISSMADDTTRSFKIEILINSPPAGTLTGISAQINIPVETLLAHRVSPAILALDDNGALGIKAIDEDSVVVFHAIEVVKTESNGAWVTGLPNDVNIITLGQGFVNPGELVEPIAEQKNDKSSNAPETGNSTL